MEPSPTDEAILDTLPDHLLWVAREAELDADRVVKFFQQLEISLAVPEGSFTRRAFSPA